MINMKEIDNILSVIVQEEDAYKVLSKIPDLYSIIQKALTADYQVLFEFIIRQQNLSVERGIPGLNFSLDLFEYNMTVGLEKLLPKLELTESFTEWGIFYKIKIPSEKSALLGVIMDKSITLFKRLKSEENKGIGYMLSVIPLIYMEMQKEMAFKTAENFIQDVQSTEDIQVFLQRSIESFANILNITKESEVFSFSTVAESKKIKPDPNDYGVMVNMPNDIGIEIRKRDIVSIIGGEGVGKTNFSNDLSNEFQRYGFNVMYIHTETEIDKIKYMHIANFMSKYYNRSPDWKDLVSGNLTPTHQDLLDQAEIDWVEKYKGSLYTKRFIDVKNFYNEAKEWRQTLGIDVIIIDHVGRTDGPNNMIIKQKIDTLLDFEIKLKQFGLTFVNISHDNFAAASGKPSLTRVAADSGSVTKDAETVLYLHTTKELHRQNKFWVSRLKGREQSGMWSDLILQQTNSSRFKISQEDDEGASLAWK